MLENILKVFLIAFESLNSTHALLGQALWNFKK
jgi:hypothetical protein